MANQVKKSEKEKSEKEKKQTRNLKVSRETIKGNILIYRISSIRICPQIPPTIMKSYNLWVLIE